MRVAQKRAHQRNQEPYEAPTTSYVTQPYFVTHYQHTTPISAE